MPLITDVRRERRELEQFIIGSLLPMGFDRRARTTAQFRSWLKLPMNYVRMMEIPLTLRLLEVGGAGLRTLDVGSPKLLSLYLMLSRAQDIVVSDLYDYFVPDFLSLAAVAKTAARVDVFDARAIPFEDCYFDRAFSISVLEHISDCGDRMALAELCRVLKKGGIAVITLPVAPTFIEEWHADADFYWAGASVQSQRGLFYQRRYDENAIRELIASSGLHVEELLYIAEKPIKPPVLGEDGVYRHNFHYIQSTRLHRALVKKVPIPLLPYLLSRYYSWKYHYLTRDGRDPNARQVAVKLRKG